MRAQLFLRSVLLLAAACLLPQFASAQIQVAEVKHEGPVDFEKEILPIFRRNCLACHSATEAEGDIVLETPEKIIKGGSGGAAVVPGKGAESLLLKLVSHQQKPFMPPPDNDVKAKNLTPEELGLLKLWIDQGAKGEVKAAGGGPINWQALPPGVNPIYAVAISPDGQYAAAGRANQIFLYHVPSKRELGRLTDPSLLQKGIYKNPGVADLDLIQALKFSPDSTTLVSGGFRTAKFWKKPQPVKKFDLAGLETPPRVLAVSADGKWAAVGEENGKIKIFDLSNGQISKTLTGHTTAVTGVAFTADNSKLASGSTDKTFKLWNLSDGQPLGSVEAPAPITAVALVLEEKQIATALADNKLLLWALPLPAAGAEAPKPVKEIGGHGAPITSLVALAPNGAQLATGSKDGNVRVIDVASGNVAKQLGYGQPVESIAVRADGKRLAVAGAAVVKVFNGENNQPLPDIKGDFRTVIKVGDSTRAVALAKKNVELAKADLAEATKRKTAEEENDKKSKEAVPKAEEELKKKDEAAKKPVEDKAAADKALTEATEKKTKADEAKKVADEAAPKAQEALTKATQAKDAAVKAATDAAAAAKAAADKLAAAKDAAGKDAANEALKKAAEEAEKASQEAAAKQKAAEEAKVAAEKAFADADAAKKTADANKAAADKAAQESATAFNAADQKVKQVTPVAQKAVDEKNAADRALQAAKRAVERAADAVKKATEAIPGVEQIVKNFEAQVTQREQELAAATKVATESEKPLKAVAMSADGKLCAYVGDDGLVHTYDPETGAAVDIIGGFNAPLVSVAFTPAGQILVGGQNNTASLWELPTEWKLERTIGSPESAEQFTDRVTALDFSPDGKLLATGGGEPSRGGEIKIWNTADGALVKAFKEPHSDVVNCVDFSPDGTQLASCGADRFVKVWNVADAKFIRSFEGHTHHVLGVAWRADGRLLASSGADNVVKVWNTLTGDQARTVQGFTKEIPSIRFVADGDAVIVCSGDKIVRLINATNGGNMRDFPGSTDFMYSADASSDGKVIVAGGADSVFRIWNGENGQPIATFEAPKVETQTAAK
jgi:WD40 repeat protein